MTINDALAQRLGDILAPEGICVYQNDPSEHVLLGQWHRTLKSTGEFSQVFPEQPSLPDFISSFTPPVVLLYTLDAALRITHAGWFSPIARGAFISLWFDASIRSTRRQYEITRAGCDFGLSVFDVLIFGTRLSSVIALAQHLGFEIFDKKLPYLFDAHSYTVGFLTRDNFKSLRARKEG